MKAIRIILDVIVLLLCLIPSILTLIGVSQLPLKPAPPLVLGAGIGFLLSINIVLATYAAFAEFNDWFEEHSC